MIHLFFVFVEPVDI